MAVALEQFVNELIDSGIVAADTLKEFIPPRAAPKDAEELARELVRKNMLTKFQAEELWNGNGKTLTLGSYVLMERIGAGGMGQVYKARHRIMDRFVAVKRLPCKLTADQAAIARFRREVKAASRISHPNIVRAYDADQVNGIPFLVMELVEGSDLAALVRKNGPFSVHKAVGYTLQAARGLEAAHKDGIVHRDIKPANLMLDAQEVVKILDMGLARFGGDGNDSVHADLTSTGTIMGTADYMAPEQALDTKTVDSRADIYSLGCSLHFLLTGEALYQGDTLMKKLLAHREHPIPSLRTSRPEVSEQLDDVFKKLVAKKAGDRYQSMTQAIAELERCHSGPAASVCIQPSATATLHGAAAEFEKLDEMPSVPLKSPGNATLGKPQPGHNKRIYATVGAAFLAIAILAAIIVSIQTKDGTLIVEVDQPDATVQVMDSEGIVNVIRKHVDKTVSISVDPGRHRLKVEKDGFAVFGKEFEIEAGGKAPIKARLVPLEVKPAMAGAKPAVAAEVKQSLFFQTSGFANWRRDVSGMPPEKQIEAVTKKLVELNPGFDGALSHLIEDNAVTSVDFVTDYVQDISPVRILAGLKNLRCRGSDSSLGQLTDLSPLRGMHLTSLECGSSPSLVDLTPLRGMPLTFLYCGNSGVSDLSPLHDMPLLILWTEWTSVADLSPLANMPLTQLVCHKTQVADLSPLKGLPLTYLDISGTLVSDLSPLRGVKLKSLWCGDIQIADLSPLKDMPLEVLKCWSTKVSELSSLKGMPLTDLDISRTQVADLSPLQGMKLKALGVSNTQVADLSPVRDMPLENLMCWFTKVDDLGPLKGMRLQRLICSETPVSDLSPLRGMPLKVLQCCNSRVSDLSPLQGMSLTELLFTPGNITQGIDVIRDMKTIKNIGFDRRSKDIDHRYFSIWAPDEFWTRYGAGEFGKPRHALEK